MRSVFMKAKNVLINAKRSRTKTFKNTKVDEDIKWFKTGRRTWRKDSIDVWYNEKWRNPKIKKRNFQASPLEPLLFLRIKSKSGHKPRPGDH